MTKDEKLTHIDALISEVKMWPAFHFRPGIESFIRKAQFQIKTMMSFDSHFIKDIDVFAIKNDNSNYEIELLEVLNNLRFEVMATKEETQSTERQNEPAPNLNGKIFISHSTLDHDFVYKFRDHILILGLDLKKEEIFCTSIDETGVKSGEDFKERIRDELYGAKAVIQILTENYKRSEVCLNEMGAAWALGKLVIPLVVSNDYDIGFIHANTQQLKLNDKHDLIKLRDDHQGKLFKLGVNTGNYMTQIDAFLEFMKKYSEESKGTEKDSVFFYDEECKLRGIIGCSIFGHPPAEKFEDSDSFHRYYFIIPEHSVDVLSNESLRHPNNANAPYFNQGKIQLIQPYSEHIFNFKEWEGKKVEVKGTFMGGHTAWHQTSVLMRVTNIREI